MVHPEARHRTRCLTIISNSERPSDFKNTRVSSLFEHAEYCPHCVSPVSYCRGQEHPAGSAEEIAFDAVDQRNAFRNREAMSAARESADRSMVGPVVRLRVGLMGIAPVRGVIGY